MNIIGLRELYYVYLSIQGLDIENFDLARVFFYRPLTWSHLDFQIFATWNVLLSI